MNPCTDYCRLRFGREYSEACDYMCDYAKAVKERKEIIDSVLETLRNLTETYNPDSTEFSVLMGALKAVEELKEEAQ